MTGAISPVTALSSTEAMPSTISPSAGMMSPASTRKRSPLRKAGGGNHGHILRRSTSWRAVQFLGLGLLAGLAQRLGLGLAAPFGHRFGEVGEQHGEPQPERDGADETGRALRPCRTEPGSTRPVVSTLPTSTTNMTGLRTIRRGLSLTKESRIARWYSSRRNVDCFLS